MLNDISNLLTDMILGGADWAEIAPVVQLSMDIMDKEKENRRKNA